MQGWMKKKKKSCRNCNFCRWKKEEIFLQQLHFFAKVQG